MGRQRDRDGRAGRPPGPTPGFYPIETGTAELIQDRDNPGGYMLMVNGVQSSHIDLSDPTRLEFEYMRWMASVIEEAADEPLRVLHLGAGACALARYLLTSRPSSQHLAVDLDGELARLVREWFQLPKAPALRIRVGDARAVTESLPDASQTVVVRDVFAGAATPPSMTTLEFTQQVRRVLRPNGLYLINCGDAPDLRLSRMESATIGAVFSDVSIVADPPMLKGRRRGNVIIVGSDSPIDSPALVRKLLGGAVPAQLWNDRRVREFAQHEAPLRDSATPETRQCDGPAPTPVP
jgi:spermidine synthase